MGILDQVIGAVVSGGTGSPIAGALMNVLGGQQTGGNVGGLQGLVSSFEQAGLGHVIQSWIGTGPNQPVSPNQLQSVFGQSRIDHMANEAGVPPQDFLSQLSQHLPNVVDGMTPNGRLPKDTVEV
jgi:uncharacterized protein YidB (DUF937 family)